MGKPSERGKRVLFARRREKRPEGHLEYRFSSGSGRCTKAGQVEAGAFRPLPQAARFSQSTVQTDNTLKVRFSTTIGEEPEIDLEVV